MKKIIALALLICMLCPMLVFAADSEQTQIFSDIAVGAANSEYVEVLVEKGVIKGCDEDIFKPNDVCTRGQFLTFLWRAVGSPKAEKCAEIKDITGDEYYADAVYWAYKNGITKIYSDGTFKANAPTDREHAAYYLYNWAKLYGYGDLTKTKNMNKYLEDAVYISPDSRTAYAWAMASGIIAESGSDYIRTVIPKATVKRLWSINAIGKLLMTHVCTWGDWADNGDGTHTRVCKGDASHKETKAHQWNDGELTIKPAETQKGLVTYTCTDCKLTKTEEAAPGAEFLTRADLEEAITTTAFSYYAKGPKIQYDETHLTDLNAHYGGLIRLSPESSPEFSTKDNTLFAVCSDYTFLCYYEGLGIKDMGETTWPFGLLTSAYFGHADNQNQEQVISNQLIEPLTEDDVDTSVFRWIDYDKYDENKDDRTMSKLMSYGVFESSSFTDLTPELTFKDDGFEGEFHYSYYDKDGNRVSYKDVRTKYLDPKIADYDAYFRPGDIVVDHSHALIYVGNGRLLHSSSYKGTPLNTTTGVTAAAPNGSILGWTTIEEYINIEKAPSQKSLIIVRPLEFVLKAGYDEDPANDIVKDFEIPEKTKSRIKYPMIDIDRTVDITHYGTAVRGENLTYTVEIANKTDMKHYQTWKGEGASQDYENIVVTEKIPVGCEYVEGSATNGGTYKNGVITWNIAKIAPAEAVSVSYSVKVTAKVGSTIVSDGGMVDNIPSNVIKNTVGDKKLSEQASVAISKIAEGGNDALEGFGADTAFANNIYKQIGKELSLPAVGELTKELFPITSHVPGYAREISYVPNFKAMNLYVNQAIENTENSPYKQMVIDTFWGGRKFYVGDALKWNFAENAIKEFRPEYLEAGDIIIYAATNDKENLSYNFDTVGVMVYDGKNLLSSVKTAEGTTYEIFAEEMVAAELTKLFMKNKDLFFALRPSQVK